MGKTPLMPASAIQRFCGMCRDPHFRVNPFTGICALCADEKITRYQGEPLHGDDPTEWPKATR